jgi:acetolactate synthase I/II/III large subunit
VTGGRTTVAAVIADGLRRAGTPRLFGLALGRADHPILAAARAIGLPVALAAGEAGAWVMAGVSGDLVDAPGAVVIDEPSVFAFGMRDRAPMILLTSGHPSAVPGCKETLGVEAESAAHRIAHASRLAMSEPRGPVHLDIPAGVAASAAIPLATSCRPDPLPYPDAVALDRAARALSDASRPLLLAGLHARSADAAQWLRAFVEALPAPLLTTARAKGALPDPHPLMLGVLGVGGVEEHLVKRADLVVAIGLDTLEADALPEACWSSAPVLVFGPAAVPDGRAPAGHVAGDVSAIIEELAIRLRDKPRADWDVAEVDRLRREGAARGAGDGLTARVVRLAREATPAGTIATVDAGAYRGCVATAWHAIAPREFVASNDLAAGFALPAAIAAHLAHPDRRVVCFTGPNELGPAVSELETAARLAARIIIVVNEVGGTDASASMRLAESVGLFVSAVDDEASFSRALGHAFTAAGGSLVVVRS